MRKSPYPSCLRCTVVVRLSCTPRITCTDHHASLRSSSSARHLDSTCCLLTERPDSRYNLSYRVCCALAGQQLAKVNMPTALAMLISAFKFELAPEVCNQSVAWCCMLQGLPGHAHFVYELKIQQHVLRQ